MKNSFPPDGRGRPRSQRHDALRHLKVGDVQAVPFVADGPYASLESLRASLISWAHKVAKIRIQTRAVRNEGVVYVKRVK